MRRRLTVPVTHCCTRFISSNLKNHTTIFSEWYALDLVKNQDGAVVGCTALCIETGEVVYFKARATVLATGGAGRIYQSTMLRRH
ncbi:FAD-binding protein [Escherichia coli]